MNEQRLNRLAKIKSLLQDETAPIALERLLTGKGYLRTTGWSKTIEKATQILDHFAVVDASGKELPWFTYPATDYLKPLISPKMKVFEYGSGFSTLWWSKRVSEVVSCEHDQERYAYLSQQLPPNVDYRLHPLTVDGEYSKCIKNTAQNFDVCVIDGRDRVNCAKYAIESLSNWGIIIWDNSDREEYKLGYQLLSQNNFRRIDFWGLGPVNSYSWCTSIFYRRNNCLGI